MSLVKCPECGKEISSKSEKCVHCGFPLYKRYKITLTGFEGSEAYASEGLIQVLHLNYDYDTLSNILNNSPYEVGEFNSEKEAFDCAQQLKKYGLIFYLEDSQGKIIDSTHIINNSTSSTVTDEYTALKQIAKDVHFLTGFLQVVIALVCLGLFFSLLGSCVM